MEFDDRVTMDLLRPAADGLRRALQRMDEDDVPAPLRPLADSSARRLPPPLVKRALAELDGSEWLRDEVLAEFELEEGSPSRLFVARPDGWERRLEELVGRADDRRRETERSTLERELAEARARIARLEEDRKEDTDRVAAAERRARDRLRDEVEAAERARRRAENRARDEARRAAEEASRVERLTAERAASERRIESLRQMLEKERRAASAQQASEPARGWFPSEPMAMAEELDRIHGAVRRPSIAAEVDQEPEGPLRLPAGVRPDRVEAIHWLMRRPLRWLIDGYNVAFQVDDEPDSATRTRLVAAGGRLAALAAPGSMVVVVFDSSVDSSSLPAERRVRVVYAPSADEWILEQAVPGAVVVSSDRRVREEAESAGSLGVWSEALAAWIAAGGTVGT